MSGVAIRLDCTLVQGFLDPEPGAIRVKKGAKKRATDEHTNDQLPLEYERSVPLTTRAPRRKTRALIILAAARENKPMHAR